jgi:hypothetical protein
MIFRVQTLFQSPFSPEVKNVLGSEMGREFFQLYFGVLLS